MWHGVVSRSGLNKSRPTRLAKKIDFSWCRNPSSAVIIPTRVWAILDMRARTMSQHTCAKQTFPTDGRLRPRRQTLTERTSVNITEASTENIAARRHTRRRHTKRARRTGLLFLLPRSSRATTAALTKSETNPNLTQRNRALPQGTAVVTGLPRVLATTPGEP